MEAVYHVCPIPRLAGRLVRHIILPRGKQRPPEPRLALRRPQSEYTIFSRFARHTTRQLERSCWNSADYCSPRRLRMDGLSANSPEGEVTSSQEAERPSSVLVWGQCKIPEALKRKLPESHHLCCHGRPAPRIPKGKCRRLRCS
jgi:hypothetical protein